jgi:hypothetical protein
MDAGHNTPGPSLPSAKIIGLSSFAGLMAPLVFLVLVALRKARRRFKFDFKFWNKRVKAEIARWT